MATDITSTGAILALDKGKQIPLYAKRDIALVRGEGVYLFDSDGNRYLDAMSNYGVAVLGHAHPRFSAAVAEQLQTLTTCHQSFANDVRAELLAEIDTIAPEGVTRSFLSNSGTEAIEAALKFARASTGRTKIVAARRGYHGRTFGALSATADKKYRAPFEPLPIPAVHIGYNDADALEAAVDADTAAIVLEPIQGEGGIHPGDDAFLKRAREIATATGALLIHDEIQSGFRTGAPWAASAAGVVPDIAVTAKALANGLPIGLTMVTEAISEQMPAGAHGSTFGGNPLVARGALETLRIMRDEGLYDRAQAVGARVVAGITALESPKIRAVRGRGLMMGIELKQKATPVLRGLQENGVLALMAGTLVIRVLPPMTWEEEHADAFVATLARVLESV
ncbi:MAG TPA: aspartate aminotransferase family protein [Thermomicrobiales bacterium]|nr:aspartate aminotransferase family protein [Thermomicrobiales bacterium]